MLESQDRRLGQLDTAVLQKALQDHLAEGEELANVVSNIDDREELLDKIEQMLEAQANPQGQRTPSNTGPSRSPTGATTAQASAQRSGVGGRHGRVDEVAKPAPTTKVCKENYVAWLSFWVFHFCHIINTYCLVTIHANDKHRYTSYIHWTSVRRAWTNWLLMFWVLGPPAVDEIHLDGWCAYDFLMICIASI